MSAFLSGSEKGLLMGRPFPGGIHDTQNLPEFSPHSSKPFRGRTPHSLPGCFRLRNQCCPGEIAEQGATACLLLQLSSKRGGGEISEDAKADPGVGNHSQKNPTLLPSSYSRSPNRISDEASTA